MFDASAKLPPSGVFQGNIHFPGNFDSCLEVVAPTFRGKYFMLTFVERDLSGTSKVDDENVMEIMRKHPDLSWKLPTPVGHKTRVESGRPDPLLLLKSGVIRLGRCFPSVCTDSDVIHGFHNFFTDSLFPLSGAENITVLVRNSHAADDTIELDSSDWGMIVVIGLFIVLVIMGTIIDMIINILQMDVLSQKLVQIFQGFSLYLNTLKLFNTRGGNSDSLDCINGIRFLSMTWVLIGHAYGNFTGTIFVNNLSIIEGEQFQRNGAFAVVANAFPSVDSFFLIGATLLSYITLKELDKTNGGGIKFWVLYYVHRYIRLTGVYAIIIGFHATLLKFFAFAPQSNLIYPRLSYGCQKHWSKSLLYVNNLRWVSQDKHMVQSCLGQTWYMASDMQMFLVSPFIIWSLWKKEKTGLILSGVLMVAATIVPFTLSWVQDYPFSPLISAGATGVDTYMKDFYIVPWCRFQPYIVGLLLGFVLHKMRKQPSLKLNAVVLTWIWAAAFATGAAVIYGLNPYQIDSSVVASKAARSFYNGFHRLAWSFALSWVILACVKEVGGPVNSILSWRAWSPLAKMSYCIYLVHLTVLPYYSSLASYTVTISNLLCIYFIIFILGVCIAVSYICVVLFEAPCVHLEKLFFALIGISKLPSVRYATK